MDSIEKECRQLAKQLDRKFLIKKVGDKISVYHTVTIRRVGKTFNNWQEVLDYLKSF